jgi:PAT family acetyl-CoA transporter-like MFS transporter 1
MDLNSQLSHDAVLMETSLFLESEVSSKEAIASKKESAVHQKGDYRKDLGTIIFLMYLYFLQGIPLGLTGAIPLILGARKVGFSAQGTFSLSSWPFAVKLFWWELFF